MKHNDVHHLNLLAWCIWEKHYDSHWVRSAELSCREHFCHQYYCTVHNSISSPLCAPAFILIWNQTIKIIDRVQAHFCGHATYREFKLCLSRTILGLLTVHDIFLKQLKGVLAAALLVKRQAVVHILYACCNVSSTILSALVTFKQTKLFSKSSVCQSAVQRAQLSYFASYQKPYKRLKALRWICFGHPRRLKQLVPLKSKISCSSFKSMYLFWDQGLQEGAANLQSSPSTE